MSKDKDNQNNSVQKVNKSNEKSSTGCRGCDCTAYVQRAGGGIVCGNESCRHGKGTHGSIN